MPLLDHFHPPLGEDRRWESFHSSWATRIADGLNDNWLPERFFAEENTRSGARFEIDVATYDRANPLASLPGGATLPHPSVWTPPPPDCVATSFFPTDFEVKIISTRSGPAVVAAIELISPANKDRPESRQAFVAKCANYLHQGVSLVIIDIVTNRRANLHQELCGFMNIPLPGVGDDPSLLYAAAYRPVIRNEREEIDVWFRTFSVGDPLPSMPLRLSGDWFVPVEFDAAYTEACRRRRIA